MHVLEPGSKPDVFGVEDYKKNPCGECGKVIIGPPESLADHVRAVHLTSKDGKKCRGHFGLLRIDKWCRMCKLKKKCELFCATQEEIAAVGVHGEVGDGVRGGGGGGGAAVAVVSVTPVAFKEDFASNSLPISGEMIEADTVLDEVKVEAVKIEELLPIDDER